jgi:hypothetical protein
VAGALIQPHDVAYPILVEVADADRDNRLHAILQRHPNYTISGTLRPLMRFKRAEDAELFFDGMRKAGVPE